MKTLRVGITSYDEMKSRTLKIARGEIKPSDNDPKVWFTSAESFAKVLSEKNRLLLAVIAQQQPKSLTELANETGREKSNLSRTLKTMERYGFVTLSKGAGGRIVPKVPYTNIVLSLPVMPYETTPEAA